MTYAEAVELIEQSRHKGKAAVLIGCPGGFKRYVWIEHVRDGDWGAVKVALMGSHIATIAEDDSIELFTRGWDTATTRLALNHVLGSRGGLWADKGKLYHHRYGGEVGEGRRTPFVEGMTVERTGQVTV